MATDSASIKTKGGEKGKDAPAASSKDSGSKHAKDPARASTATPGAAGDDDPPISPASSSQPSLTAAAVMEYLKTRGFERSEAVLKAELEALSAGKSPEAAHAAALAAGGPAAARTMTLTELAAKSAPRDLVSGGDKTGPGPGPLELLAADALRVDKTDRIRGFGMVRNWCEGGLDVYQSELRPLLLPLFVHAYLDLIEMGLETAAFSFYTLHSSALLPQNLSLLSHLRSITLRTHMSADELTQHFRSERYVLKMSQTVFGLLLGWLTDGTGPVAAAGAAESVGGEAEGPATRGRLAMLRIINERCRIQVLHAKPYELTPTLLEEGTGLTGAGPSCAPYGRSSRQFPVLQANAVSEGGDAIADFNARNAGPQLKLGPDLPLNDRLKEEVQREVEEELRAEREQRQRRQRQQSEENRTNRTDREIQDESAAGEPMEGVEAAGEEGGSKLLSERAKSSEGTPGPSGTGTPGPGSGRKTAAASAAPQSSTAKDNLTSLPTDILARGSDLLQPTAADLPPNPPVFRTVDIMREVAKIRDLRKSLRIDMKLLNKSKNSAEAKDHFRSAALPSVCAYTYHDVQDGLTCSTFSEDLSLMAAGFEESYVQVWSLKGESLSSLRGDVALSEVRDSTTLNRQRVASNVNEVSSTRKLIGHSGPVYGLSFDTIGGSAASPRTLLSCSADATVRLWSMDTLSALVAYRGHQGPVWDVAYSPASIYFATAGHDKTARLWNTERINPLRIYAGHLSDVDCLDFHPNSLFLATGSSDRTARLWDVQRGACVRLFVGHSSPVSTLKVSPDGRYLVTAGSGSPASTQHVASASSKASCADEESSISLWDLGSGRRIKKMWGHSGRVHALDFSNDGGLLVSTADDMTVRCWDILSAGGERQASARTLVGPDSTSGGRHSAPSAEGIAARDAGGAFAASAGEQNQSSQDCVAVFRTKRTPMLDVRVTRRNLCLVAGAYDTAQHVAA
ncbi:unnamed protein product [Parajaminaea phylloscopi]